MFIPEATVGYNDDSQRRTRSRERVEEHTVMSEAAAKATPRPLERTIADLNPSTKRPVFIESGRSWFVQTRPRWKSSAGVLGSQESEKTLSWAAEE